MKTIVVNLIGGAGSGKSRNMARLFAMLKDEGINCEMVHEYAKELAWEGKLDSKYVDEIAIFREQAHRQNRLNGKVDVIITDAPLHLKLMYKPEGLTDSETWHMIEEEACKFNNMNYMLHRVNQFNTAGRVQTEIEANAQDKALRILYNKHIIDYKTVSGNADGMEIVKNDILGTLHNLRIKEILK